MRRWLPSAIRAALLACAVLVVTASECPFLPIPGTIAVLCFTEVPVGPITPGRVTLQLREFCPDGPVVGTMDFFFLGRGAGVPNATYERLPGGGIRVVNGAFATDNASIEIPDDPDFAPYGMVVKLHDVTGVDADDPARFVGFDAAFQVVCSDLVGGLPPVALFRFDCPDAALGQFQGQFIPVNPQPGDDISFVLERVELLGDPIGAP